MILRMAGHAARIGHNRMIPSVLEITLTRDNNNNKKKTQKKGQPFHPRTHLHLARVRGTNFPNPVSIGLRKTAFTANMNAEPRKTRKRNERGTLAGQSVYKYINNSEGPLASAAASIGLAKNKLTTNHSERAQRQQE